MSAKSRFVFKQAFTNQSLEPFHQFIHFILDKFDIRVAFAADFNAIETFQLKILGDFFHQPQTTIVMIKLSAGKRGKLRETAEMFVKRGLWHTSVTEGRNEIQD